MRHGPINEVVVCLFLLHLLLFFVLEAEPVLAYLDFRLDCIEFWLNEKSSERYPNANCIFRLFVCRP